MAQTKEIDEPYQKGKIEDGFRVGIWHYYDSEEKIALTFDYDSNILIHLMEDTASYLLYDENWTVLRPERQVRYLGSYSHLFDFLAMNMSRTYSSAAGKKNINTIIILELEFDKTGQLISKKVLGEHREYFDEAILEIAGSIPEYWIPAVYNGKTVKSKIAFPLIYTTTNNKKKQPKIDNLDYIGKLMSPIVILGYGTRR